MRKWIFAAVLGIGISGCAPSEGLDNAKMVGSWTGGTPANYARITSNTEEIESEAVFTDDGKVKVILHDPNKDATFGGGYSRNGDQLKLNILGFGGPEAQIIDMQGDSFTMESVMGRITFSKG